MHRLIPWLSDYWVVFDSSSWHPRRDIGGICNRCRDSYVLISSIRGNIRFVELESSISCETTITTPGAATHISSSALPLLSLIYRDINLSRGLVCGALSVNLSASTSSNYLVRGVSGSLPWQVWWDGWLWPRTWPLLDLSLLLGCLVRL
jgi:hypothetical protein